MDATPATRRETGADEAPPDRVGPRPSARDEVLAAAARAFMERGFAAASIDDVAQAMGATKGRVYHYYRAKLDLFVDVVRRSLEMIGEETAAAAEGAEGPADRLAAMTRAHMGSILRDQPFHRCALQGVELHLLAATTPAQREKLDGVIAMRDAYQRLFENALADGIAAGVFRRCDVKVAARTMLAALNGAVAWYRPRPGETDADRERLAHEIADFALAGVAAPDGDKESKTEG